MGKTVKRVGILCLIGMALCVLAMLYAKHEIDKSSEGRVFVRVEDIPKRKVGLVLGCSPTLGNGQRNLYFSNRMRAAKELYSSGKVDFLLVSGDNSSKDYDEPTAMKRDLVQAGIPEEKIFCDYAGLSTLDSVVRAHKVFGEGRFTVVSQGFHVRRAIYVGLA